MPRYKITIEFDTDKQIKFPHDAQLLEAMQVQAESLSDGTISSSYKVSMKPGTIQLKSVCDTCHDYQCKGC